MGYIKTGMGGPLDSLREKYSTESVQVQHEEGKVITDEVAKGLEWERNFIASLPNCTDGKTGEIRPDFWLYTNKEGRSYCTRDPVHAYMVDHGIIEPSGTWSMPLLSDNRENVRAATIEGIREGYLDMLVKAQGDNAAREKATKAGVAWDLREFGFDHAWNQKTPPKKLELREYRPAKYAMRNALQEYDYLDPAKAADDPEVAKGIKMVLAVAAHNFAMQIDKWRKEVKENTAEHRPAELAKMCMGFPTQYQACCLDYAQKRGMTAEKIQAAFNKGEFNNCMAQIASENAAAQQRKMIMVAGVVAAGVVGLALLKKGLEKKGRK